MSWLSENYLEITGFLSSLIFVFYSIKLKTIAWFWAIVSSAISATFFLQLQLFGDAILQLFFIVSSFYGWYAWLQKPLKSHKKPIIITFLSKKQQFILLIWAISIWGLSLLLLSFLKGDFIYWDSLTTTLSIIATWLAARKYIENWLLWIVTDCIYTCMYFAKNAYWYALLYALFTFLAWKGYLAWKQMYQKTEIAL
ncbi:MAG: nicotinamide riboside transporter PnuC [Thermonemataceae bacterium]|nr:nicotinamide riboside transporter PnuC [Thermonemataceae bacterium]